jgi:PAS domain S-box-containing protein
VAVHGSRSFSADDQELLAAIGAQVGIAIENARLYQEALTSEEKYRDLFENATVAIFVQDLEGTINAANKACRKLTGYEPAALIGTSVDALVPSGAREVARVQRALLGGEALPRAYDTRLRRQDGVESIVAMTTRLVSEGGKPVGFQHIGIDVTEARRMRDTLNYYLRQVLTAQEEERKRIARELHDEMGQSMLLILQGMDSLSYGTMKQLSELDETELEKLRTVVLQALANLRRLTRDLRPQILDDLGLVAAVEWLAEDVERQCGIETSVRVTGEQQEVGPEVQLLLFRIVQEALTNVRKHSAAQTARVVLAFGEGIVRATVEDDGQGFSAGDLSELAGAGKLGILGMSERARLVGGSITLASEPGRGTRVVAELPV